MTNPLNPPISPRDAQRPATAADLATDDLAHRAWVDYAADVQQRARDARAQLRQRYFAACAAGKITLGGQLPQPIVVSIAAGPCPYCQQPHGDLQRRDAHGATLGEILKARGIARVKLAAWTGYAWSTIDSIVYGTKIPSQATREKIAAALGYDPNTIAWPERKEQTA